MPERRTTYLNDNGSTPEPPPGGWSKVKVRSDFGKKLIGYIHSGHITPELQPKQIWTLFPVFQSINPNDFRDFVVRCRTAANKSNQSSMPPKRSTERTPTKKPADPDDSGEDYEQLNFLDSDDEDEIIKPLQRMSINQSNSTTKINMDPPRNGNAPKPLVRLVDMKNRNSDVHLYTLPVQRENGVLLVIDKLAGVAVQNIDIIRCLRDYKMVTIEWDSTIPN
eukprot:CCRYP_005576-RB/>CCRYP_005576-RB protein AED:0.43 eAED:0.43 QI:264/1/0.5/1/1/0.5/2/0/221